MNIIVLLLIHVVQGSELCHRPMTYNEIWKLLRETPCAAVIIDRSKRADGDTASTNNIYALQTTVNDHRTMIDDHRRMIQYIMNTTMNITQFNEFYKEHHSQTYPIWRSWRDMSILVLVAILLVGIIYLVIVYAHPLELLTNLLIQRREKQQHTKHQARRQPSDVSMVYTVEQAAMHKI